MQETLLFAPVPLGEFDGPGAGAADRQRAAPDCSSVTQRSTVPTTRKTLQVDDRARAAGNY